MAARAYPPTGTTRDRPPLPRNSTVLFVQIEIVDGQSDRLGDARPGAVEELEQRDVAQRHRVIAGAGRVQQPAHLVDTERPRQPAQRRRWTHLAARVVLDQPLPGGEPVQSADSAHRASGRCGGQRRVALPKRSEVRGDVALLDPVHGHPGGFEVGSVAGEVAPVRRDRCCRQGPAPLRGGPGTR